MTIVTKRELVQDNIRAFGHREAAEIARREMCHTHFYWLAFGTRPPILTAPPTEAAKRCREVLHQSARTHIGRIAGR